MEAELFRVRLNSDREHLEMEVSQIAYGFLWRTIHHPMIQLFFDKTAFVKLEISNNFKQNIDETDLKQPNIHRNIHTSLWIFKVSSKKSTNQKSRDFCQFFLISNKTSIG